MPQENNVYLSPYQLGYLGGIDEVINLDFFKERGLEKIPTNRLFFNFLLQSGAQKISMNPCSLFKEEFDTLYPVIRSRIKFIKSKNEILAGIRFKNFLTENLKHKRIIDNKNNLRFIESLSMNLGTMIFCIDNDLSFISPGILDINLKRINSLFKPETAIPLFTFLGKIKHYQIISDESRSIIDAREVKLIEEILKSNYYLGLSKEHFKLKSNKNNPNHIIQRLELLAKELKNNYDSKLKLRNQIISTLDFSSNILSMFGDFTKSVSTFIYNRIKRSILTNRRLVIYDSKPFLTDLTKSRLEELLNQHYKRPRPKV